jgi:hypothetical protein
MIGQTTEALATPQIHVNPGDEILVIDGTITACKKNNTQMNNRNG